MRWQQGYPVVRLGAEAEDLPLAGEEVFLEGKALREVQNMVVFAERSGGGRDFSSWVRKQLSDRWIIVCGAAWQRPLYHAGQGEKELPRSALASPKRTTSARSSSADKDTGEHPQSSSAEVNRDLEPAWAAALDAVDALGSSRSSDERAAALTDWAVELKAPFHLLLRDISGLGEAKALEVATALRLAMDTNACPHLRVLVASTAETLFADTAERSGYLSLAQRFRLCGLRELEVQRLAQEGELQLSEEVLREMLEDTGGQPLLVQLLLGKLKLLASASGEVTLDEVRRAYRELTRSLPGVEKHWCADLKAVLRRNPELVPALRAYVQGKTVGTANFPPPAVERGLFIGGWLRLNRLGRWGITSRLHADLARTVLDDFRG